MRPCSAPIAGLSVECQQIEAVCQELAHELSVTDGSCFGSLRALEAVIALIVTLDRSGIINGIATFQCWLADLLLLCVPCDILRRALKDVIPAMEPAILMQPEAAALAQVHITTLPSTIPGVVSDLYVRKADPLMDAVPDVTSWMRFVPCSVYSLVRHSKGKGQFQTVGRNCFGLSATLVF